jgi:DNA polymerase-1
LALFGGIDIPGHPDLDNIRKLDLLPIPTLRRMNRIGFAIDREYSHSLTSEFSAEMRDLERDISSYIPPDRLHEFVDQAITAEAKDAESDTDISTETGFVRAAASNSASSSASASVLINVNSSEQIAKLLFEVLGLGAGKRLQTTKTGRVSTNKKQLRDLEREHPVVPKILAYKERAKLISTYTKGLPAKAVFHPRGECCPVCELHHVADTWRVHAEATTTRAETGRVQMKNPPLQTIPQRTELGARVRAVFVASPGTKLVSVDLGQIELRVMAHLANCASMIKVYQDGGDIHEQTAMQCFGLSDKSQIDKVSHRIPSKTANFLTQYGGSGKALYQQVLMAFLILISEGKLDKVPDWLTMEWCDRFIDNWFGQRPEVREYMDLQVYRARRYGLVWDPFGRVRLVPEIRSTHSWIKEAGGRQAGNMPDQGMAANILKLIMAEVAEYLQELRDIGVWCHELLPVHDQLITEVEEDWAERVKVGKMRIFDDAMRDKDSGEWRFRVPLGSDGEVLDRWKKG